MLILMFFFFKKQFGAKKLFVFLVDSADTGPPTFAMF
jgi:hypothetical protein